MEKEFFRYDEAGQILGCSKDHVSRLVLDGRLVRVYIGGSKKSSRITRESIERYIAEVKRKNGSDLHPP